VTDPRQLLYIVLDGLGDEASAELGGKTPLQAARTPSLDALAREGQVFRLSLTDREGNVSTDVGQFALLGYAGRHELPRRGPIEAAATGIELMEGDVALRANFATLDERGRIVDRRAGRIREGASDLCHALDGTDLGDDVIALVRGATEHRVAVVLRGPGLGSRITDSDPGSLASGPASPLAVRALAPGDSASARTAAKLEAFLARARALLEEHPLNVQRRAAGLPPANALITRKAGSHVALESLEQRFGLRCAGVAGERTVLGVLRLLGCEVTTRPEFTANVDTALEAKLEAALKLLEDDRLDLVLVHVKATDILAHDRMPREKAEYLERLDGALGAMLDLLPEHVLVALASDHSTSSTSGDHTLAPIPALLWGEGVPPSGAPAFDEPSLAALGGPLLDGSAFFERLLAALGKRDQIASTGAA
jgi:2,3-bisphosphoglycerate-independent phosphoglycerate mutase